MTRVLFWIVLAVLAVWWLRRLTSGPRVPADPPPQPPAALPPSHMVACARCGLHVVADDAVADEQGRPYCSDSHRTQGPEGAS